MSTSRKARRTGWPPLQRWAAAGVCFGLVVFLGIGVGSALPQTDTETVPTAPTASGGFLRDAVEPAPTDAGPTMDLTRAAVNVFVALVIVLVLVLVLAYVLRRASYRLRQTGGGTVSVLARIPLGPSQFLTVVDIAGEVLVLGVTEHSVTALSEIDSPGLIDKLRQEGPLTRGTPGLLQGIPTFRQWLHRAQHGNPE